MKTLLIITLILTLYLGSKPLSTFASTSESNDYIFHMNVNTDPDQSDQMYTKPIKKLLETPTPLPTSKPSPTPIPRPSTKITVGYTDKEPVSDFALNISETQINLAPLLPGDAITRRNTLIVSGDLSYMYTLLGSENHQLRDEKNAIIPNTTCDDGSCTQTTAADWTNVLTYGFGYRCDSITGHDCDRSFQNQDMYRQFADTSVHEPQIALAAGLTSQPKKETITYKVNIPGSQEPGYYSNTITYLALPMY